MTRLRLIGVMCGLALWGGCNDGASRGVCDDGTTVARAGTNGCALATLITETGFLCPEELPSAWSFGDDYVLCLPDGDEPSAADEQALCEALAGEGYTWDGEVCVAPDGDSVSLEPIGSDPSPDAGDDAGGSEPDVGGPDVGTPDTTEPDAGTRDTGEPDADPVDAEPDGGEPTDTNPTDAGAPDADPDTPDSTDAPVSIACASDAADACPEGMQCVQTAPPYCSADWVGVCAPVESEDPCPALVVCGCDGQTFGDACQARASGYTQIFVSCADECPGVADSCDDGCFEMSAFPYDEERGCTDYSAGAQVVGCTSLEGGTDDAPCVKRANDGALFIATSGSAFLESEEWTDCTEEEAERAQTTGCE